LIASKS